MKYLYTFFTLLTITAGFSQALHTVDFEVAGVGYDWSWIGAEGGVPEITDNPSKTGINTSDKVMKLTKGTGVDWAMVLTTDDGEFTVDASNKIMKMMVYKPKLSNVCLKFEGSGTPKEICVANTVVNTWEELSFDFTSVIGQTFSKIVVIPDNGGDTTPNTVEAGIHYFDNLVVPDGTVDYGSVTHLTTDFNSSFFTADGLTYSEANNIGTVANVNGALYNHIYHISQGGFNFSAARGVRLEIKGPRSTPILVKFEGSGGNVEVSGDYTTADSWQTIDFDFSSASNVKRDKLVIFFDIGAAASDPISDDTFEIKTFAFNALASLSVKDIDQMIQDVRIYPNPASEIVNISSAETIDRVSVYDLTGRVIKQSNPNKSSFRLNINDLNKGVYLVKLNVGDKEATTKLIK